MFAPCLTQDIPNQTSCMYVCIHMMHTGYAGIRMYTRLHPCPYPCDARTVPPEAKLRYPYGGNLHPYGFFSTSYFFTKYLLMYIVYYSTPMEKVNLRLHLHPCNILRSIPISTYGILHEPL